MALSDEAETKHSLFLRLMALAQRPSARKFHALGRHKTGAPETFLGRQPCVEMTVSRISEEAQRSAKRARSEPSYAAEPVRNPAKD